jgi:hypothetical protein
VWSSSSCNRRRSTDCDSTAVCRAQQQQQQQQQQGGAADASTAPDQHLRNAACEVQAIMAKLGGDNSATDQQTVGAVLNTSLTEAQLRA